MAIPATAFWVTFGDKRILAITLTVGFGMACLSFGAILGQNLRLPIEKLPQAFSGIDAFDEGTGVKPVG
jgi:hypothetical protein